MFRRAILIALCSLLAGCGDPLSGLERFKDLDLSAKETTAAALPTEEEIAREGYFGTSAAEGTVATPIPSAAAVEPAQKEGFLGALRRRLTGTKTDDAQADAVAAAVAQSESEVVAVEAPVQADVLRKLRRSRRSQRRQKQPRAAAFLGVCWERHLRNSGNGFRYCRLPHKKTKTRELAAPFTGVRTQPFRPHEKPARISRVVWPQGTGL